jgi:hypothetical protein
MREGPVVNDVPQKETNKCAAKTKQGGQEASLEEREYTIAEEGKDSKPQGCDSKVREGPLAVSFCEVL